MGSIKRPPEIASEVRKDYSQLSKADLIEVAFSFAQMIYGESLSAEEIMQKIQQEREILKLNRDNA